MPSAITGPAHRAKGGLGPVGEGQGENGDPCAWWSGHSTTVSISHLLACGSAPSGLALTHFAWLRGKPKQAKADPERLTDSGRSVPSSSLSLPPFCFLTPLAPFSLTLPPLPADWDECAHRSEHDCHPAARCVNLEGSYTCQCLTARDANPSWAGRVCEGMCLGGALRPGVGGPALTGVVLRATVALLFCFYSEEINVMIKVPKSRCSMGSVALYPTAAVKSNWSRLFYKRVKEPT